MIWNLFHFHWHHIAHCINRISVSMNDDYRSIEIPKADASSPKPPAVKE